MLVDLKARADLAGAVFELNNRFAKETSFLTPQEGERLIANASLALVSDDADAFLIAYDQDGDYDSPNFLWFRERYTRFLYIDRVVVAALAQGKGWGRRLYSRLIDDARALGYARIVAEINIDPPNPGSLAFHERLGFAAVGEQRLTNGKTVRYVALDVA